MRVCMHVPFRPLPQKRHRYSRGRMYDPSKTDKQLFLNLCRAQHPSAQLLGPVCCRLHFTFKRPKSHLTARGTLRKGAPARHVYKPDVDNLAKFVLDALNGVYYQDDSQIDELHVHKKYGDTDQVRVELEQLES